MVKFTLNNIGLIKDTQIELNNFTFICGKNNTGKTYVTYSIYGFLYVWNEIIDFNIKKEVLDELEENGFCRINLKDYEKSYKSVLKKLSKHYASMLDNIFSVDSEWFKDSEFDVSIDDFSLDIAKEYKSKLNTFKKDILQIKKEENSEILEISTLGAKLNNVIPHFILEQGINKSLGAIFFSRYFQHPFIITSERTGISLFYKELDIKKNIMVEHITKNKDIDPFKMLEEETSRYAIPIRHNIDYTRDLGDGVTKTKSFLYGDREIDNYFAKILNGKYKVINKEVYFMTKRSKINPSKTIPMYFASSATKSLIELYFYIKHTAKVGDILMIDEPELNLHPDNHRYITRLLAYLSNKGIKIFITTHSDFIIKELNNLIRLNNNINDKHKIIKKYKYCEDDILDSKNLTAYINDFGQLNEVKKDNMGFEIKSFDDTINELSNAMDDIYFNIKE